MNEKRNVESVYEEIVKVIWLTNRSKLDLQLIHITKNMIISA